MKRTVGLAAIVATFAATLVYAQVDPIKTRQSLMQANQDALEKMFGMADGKTAFDAAFVKTALTKFATDYENLPALFPEGSNVAPSAALPAVWTNKQAFAAAATKLSADAKAAATAVTTKAGLDGPEFQTVAGDCTNCHMQFRRLGPPGGGGGFGGPFPGGGFPGGPRPPPRP